MTTKPDPKPARPERAVRNAVAQLVVIALACVAVFGFVQAARSDDRRATCASFCALKPTYAARDRRAPDFELKDMDGKPVRLSSFRGKTVVLNFWTKTCQPCLKEMPSLQDLGKIVRDRGNIVLLAVSTDAGPDSVRDTLKVVLDGEEPSFPVLFDPDLDVVKDKFGTTLYPETWIIDPDGFIRARFDGERDWAAPFALEIAEMARLGPGCPVRFEKGKATGPHAALCAVEE
jgi:peroxiredoxin